ncbi:tRNA (adenosine(37)-N6)-threonylcarbamoyltransferase complex dimerization subunit type 1 TsaB [Nocardioides sp.]|uniref:tRNA (adenosine(37)-N6)-threonylcarbamoyltransferase complex dimerization subunit type 1 TsaB n=1 Tax=Nocardioides sp. TaxID=35761 RepID=UPI003D0B8B7E
MLLAFDTATASVTVCLYDPSAGVVLAERNGIGPMKHGELLAPAIDEVMTQAGVSREELSAIVVGVGPGPYTGLRVGVVTARTLGYALGLPVHGVCSLDAIALAAVDDGLAEPFLVTTDARRKELFWAAYDAAGERVEGPFVDKPAELPQDRPVVGAGPELYPDLFATGTGPRDPAASALARLVASGRAKVLDPEPIYLRRPDAVAPGQPKPVS